ncbi:hypothetical protein JXA85_06315 [Candidatus Woesearchaeota archaeon]|nr:hypothetical protein [Candidatus Woesearchaeota archaeon]
MSMIDKNDFIAIKKDMDDYYKTHEDIVRKSRDIIILSKQIIYSVHRKNTKQAKFLAKRITNGVKSLSKYKNSRFGATGSFKVAIQEYVEAIAYLEFVLNKKLVSIKTLKVDPEYYLMGLCDLTGELVRRAVNAGINGNFTEVMQIHGFVSELYTEMMKFDFFNGELRKKFDSIKWDLKKLDEMVFEIKMKNKI